MSDADDARARAIVQTIVYVTVATASTDGAPWNSPVYSAYDDQGNFYWCSSPEAQHSRNIEGNGRAFLVIYDSTAAEGTGEGVYVEARVVAVEDPAEIAEAKRHMGGRVGKELGADTDRLLAARQQRIYRATPTRVWVNSFEHDEHGGYVRDVRVEVSVACLKKLVTW